MAGEYKITSVRERPDITPQGKVIQVVAADFVTARGASGSVSMPVEDYTDAKMKEAIAKKARSFDALYQ